MKSCWQKIVIMPRVVVQRRVADIPAPEWRWESARNATLERSVRRYIDRVRYALRKARRDDHLGS
jgi:hypothetical protein